MPKEDLCKLLIHSIPKDASMDEVKSALTSSRTLGAASNTSSSPAAKSPSGQKAGIPEPASFDGDIAERKLFAVYAHAGVANDAFKKLPGQQSVDSMGRATKTVSQQYAGLQADSSAHHHVCIPRLACVFLFDVQHLLGQHRIMLARL